MPLQKKSGAKALESFKAGNIAEATSAANSVKEKATAAMEALGCLAQAVPNNKYAIIA